MHRVEPMRSAWPPPTGLAFKDVTDTFPRQKQHLAFRPATRFWPVDAALSRRIRTGSSGRARVVPDSRAIYRP